MNGIYSKSDKYALIKKTGFEKYFSARQWSEFNRQFFDGLAPKYDFLNEILSLGQHRQIKKKALKYAGLTSHLRILDVCTGSGDIALDIAKYYPGCTVIGIDASAKMLEIARRKCAVYPNVTFKQADALNLSFDDDSFDVAIISFGLRNLDDLQQGIREMIRVTRAGGRIVNLDLGRVNGPVKSWLYQMYFLKLIPFLGKNIFHRGEFNSFKYLPESGKYFPSQEKLVEIFTSQGLVSVRNFNFLFGAIAEQVGVVPHK